MKAIFGYLLALSVGFLGVNASQFAISSRTAFPTIEHFLGALLMALPWAVFITAIPTLFIAAILRIFGLSHIFWYVFGGIFLAQAPHLILIGINFFAHIEFIVGGAVAGIAYWVTVRPDREVHPLAA